MSNPADKVEKWDIAKLVPYARNSRTHSDEQINLMKKPDCAWNLKDLEVVSKNGLKVMSTFACGGGSSM